MFAKAVAYCNAVTEGAGEEAEDIYLWEHGTAVEPWPEPVDGKGVLDALADNPARSCVLPPYERRDDQRRRQDD